VVGDVMGRGIRAASAMAQLRAAIRAYAAIDPDPAAVLTRLDRMLTSYDTGGGPQLTTLLLALSGPEGLVIGNAGHPPPMLRHPDGRVEQLPYATTIPLGVGPLAGDDGLRTAVTVPFPPGAVLLAYTDGLVDRRGEAITEGLERLRDAARGLGGDDLALGLRRLVDGLREGSDHDDVTALALRRGSP
jgi:serine phosphatase RsbU (regulator of sigma subunit)